MAAFSTHINAAVITSGIVILPLYNQDIISMQESFFLLFLTLIGGVLPDIDADNSKPVQISFTFISIFFPLLFLLYFAKSVTFLAFVLFWIISFLSLKLLFFQLLLPHTKHRGIFHSIPMGIFIGLFGFLLFYDFFHFSNKKATLYAFFLFYGYITHLLLDEIYSINVLGLRLKRSFGSACKVWERGNFIGYVFLYTLVFVLYFLLPLDFSILSQLKQTIQNIELF